MRALSQGLPRKREASATDETGQSSSDEAKSELVQLVVRESHVYPTLEPVV